MMRVVAIVGIALALGALAGCSKRMMTERQYTLMQEDLAEDKESRDYIYNVCMSDLKVGKIPPHYRDRFSKLAGAKKGADDSEICKHFVAGVSKGTITYGRMYAAGFYFTLERKK